MNPQQTATIINGAHGLVGNLLSTVNELRSAGVADSVIRARIQTDIGAGSLGKGDLVRLVNSKFRDSQQEFFTRGQSGEILGGEDPVTAQFMWNALGTNTCPDCTSRHGKVKSFAEWQRLGLPRRGSTVCKANCRCTLLPVAKAQRLYKVNNPALLTSRAREAINTRTAEVRAAQASKGKSLAPSTEAAQIGQFRSADAARVKSPRSRPDASGQTVEARIADAEFKAQDLDPRSLIDVPTSDYADVLDINRANRARALRNGQPTDVDRYLATDPTQDRSATIRISGGKSGAVTSIAEGVPARIPKSGGRYATSHNHPDGAPVSGTDIRQLVDTDSLGQVQALKPDGTMIVLRKPTGWKAVDVPAEDIGDRYNTLLAFELATISREVPAAVRGLDAGLAALRRLSAEYGLDLIE